MQDMMKSDIWSYLVVRWFEWQKCAPSVINNVGRTPKNATVKKFTSTDFLEPIMFDSSNRATSNSRIKKNSPLSCLDSARVTTWNCHGAQCFNCFKWWRKQRHLYSAISKWNLKIMLWYIHSIGGYETWQKRKYEFGTDPIISIERELIFLGMFFLT